MRTKLIALFASVGALVGAGTAVADHDRAPVGPDFVGAAPALHTDHDLATSDGHRALRPMTQLLFDFNSARLATVGQVELEAVRDWLAAHPRAVLVIEGHTDAVGSDLYNTNLAKRRAEAVRAALIALGARADQLVIGVFGESKASSPNDAANRRVIVRGTTRRDAMFST